MAAGDLCSVAEVKAAHGLLPDNADWDDVLADYVTRASGLIRKESGRKFDKDETATARLFDLGGGADTREVWIGDLSATPTAASIIDENGITVTTLTVATDLVLLPLSRDTDEPIRGVRVRPGVGCLRADHLLSVTGAWGFPSVPVDVVEATVDTVREWLRSTAALTRSTDVDEPGFGMSRGLTLKARRIIANYRLPRFA